jgi:hypothetical protein
MEGLATDSKHDGEKRDLSQAGIPEACTSV